MSTDKYKYSESVTLNVIMKVNSDSVQASDVLVDDHTSEVEEFDFTVD